MKETSKYQELRMRPPLFKVAKNAREVRIQTTSVMCDNIHHMTLKKNPEGDFKLSGGGSSLSNWQMKYEPFEIEWKADEGKWKEVFSMISSGTQIVSQVQSR